MKRIQRVSLSYVTRSSALCPLMDIHDCRALFQLYSSTVRDTARLSPDPRRAYQRPHALYSSTQVSKTTALAYGSVLRPVIPRHFLFLSFYYSQENPQEKRFRFLRSLESEFLTKKTGPSSTRVPSSSRGRSCLVLSSVTFLQRALQIGGADAERRGGGRARGGHESPKSLQIIDIPPLLLQLHYSL